MENKIKDLLKFVYGKKAGEEVCLSLMDIINSRIEDINPRSLKVKGNFPLDETDSFLITYGDQFFQSGKKPLECLFEFADKNLKGSISGIHILPFFPFSSDDGFSVIDYKEVNPDLGSWEEVKKIGSSFKLMSDLVLNHCSVKSRWFKGFLLAEEKYKDYFITVKEDTDLSMVVRPRALPLLTAFNTAEGKKLVWTTFSADQVDLNFANPDVLLEMIDIFLFHVKQGIQVVRLDAIAFLWKEIGHSCIHHEKTHAIVKLFRAIVKEYFPQVVILTETNVPHKENMSYFGNGTDEAQMIYQFPLPPLVLDAFLREDANHLRNWASSLPETGGNGTYFNFLASHDGVGLLPAHGILSETELSALINSVKERGGIISYKATEKGDIPYEMNVNYRDAVCESSLAPELRAKKFLASQSVILSLTGVPGIYIHSLIGSGNYSEGVRITGMNRTINREKLNYAEMLYELKTPGTLRNLIFTGYMRMLDARRRNTAFHPLGSQVVLKSKGSLFAVLRISPDRNNQVLCLINTGSKKVKGAFMETDLNPKNNKEFIDIITGEKIVPDIKNSLYTFAIKPYEVLWIKQ